MNRFFGITLIVFAVALAVVPVFTDCQSQGQAITTSAGKEVPMKCHWTGIAELGVAVPLAFVGGMIAASKRKYSLRNSGILGLVMGAMAISFPNGLIGVCQTPTMICHTVMKPALTVLGSLVIAGSLGAVLLSRKAKE